MIHSLIRITSLALVLASPSIAQESPPWVVVDAPKRTHFDTLEGPEIVVRSDGTYVAKYEHEGHYSTALGTYICTSSDRGATWTRIAKLDQPRRASLFAIGERLYLLGVDGSGRTLVGHVLVRRSDDGGRTWTEPSDAASGRLHGDAGLECESSPVAIVGGRVWRIFARSDYGKNKGADVLVASAAVGADLLRADSWRWSNDLSLRALSGVAVAGSLLLDDGSDTPRLLVRNWGFDDIANARPSAEGGILQLAEDPVRRVVPREARGWRPTRDPKSGEWFVLMNPTNPTPVNGSTWNSAQLVMQSSPDCITWNVRSTLLVGGAHYEWRAWTYDGDDLIVLVCIERETGGGLTFLRVPQFRERTPQSPPLWGQLPEVAPTPGQKSENPK